MSKCELCRQRDPAITVRCHTCRDTFHLHQRQLDLVLSGSIIMADCPGCGVVNCFLKRGRRRVCYSGPVAHAGQTILDLRGKHGISG